ncbi:MAG: undecaprenyl-diphosphate phosphatase [Candidatus Gottesmanbacteria bacterium]
MNLIHALLLGFVEGITEFLPVSSTGHMILFGKLFAIPQTDFLTSFEIIIQLGAIAAAVVLYARTLLSKRFLWKPLLFAFIPTAIIGFLLYKIVKHYLLGNPFVVVASLCIGGIAFFLIENAVKRFPRKTTVLEQITPKQAICIGIGQTFSMIPGVSRSAASICSGLLTGLSRELSVEFSFLLAIPTMIAAVGLDVLKSPIIINTSTVLLLTVGLVTSFVTALLAIKTFLRFVKNNSFLPFAVYRIVLAGVFYFFVLT